MAPHEPHHPDVSQTPVLTGTSRLRDRATGRTESLDAWVERRMRDERRERQECLDEAVNAVARGDLIVEA
jgi:hypothetical protein